MISQFTYDINGITPFVIVEVDSTSQNTLFTKTINWIKETYKDPDEVIKTTIENEKVRFEGMNSGALCVKALGSKSCYDATYTIEISFKDNKYKFTPIDLEYYTPPDQYDSGNDISIPLEGSGRLYNKKGKLRSLYKTFPVEIETIFNSLNESLTNYISAKKDDW